MIRIYKCPSCGSALEYDGTQDMMVCPHCASKQSVQNVLFFESQGQNTVAGAEYKDHSGTGAPEMRCPACDALLMETKDLATAAKRCPFCQNPVIIESRLTGAYSPKYVLPFKLTKKQAKELFRKWAKKGRLTPSTFKTDATLDQSQGLYVPTWLYTYTMKAALNLTGKKERREKQGDTEVVTTETYDINLSTEGTYERVPANADLTIPRTVMEVLEPYDYNALTEFSLPYLSGFIAEKYQVSAEDLESSVKEALKADLIENSKEQVRGYDEVTVNSDEIQFTDSKVEYALLPVWLLNYQYGQKKFPLYMNGQTGTIHGKLPLSKGKLALVFGIVFAVVLVILIILWRVLR